jgi:Tol biopolymer transport system component
MRPVAVVIAALLVSGVAAYLALKTLWPYPPRFAAASLVALCAAIAVAAVVGGVQREPTTRNRAVAAALVAGVVLPFVAVQAVPGIAQPRTEPIPGGRPRVLYAAPDGTWDLYLMPHGDADGLVELTDTPNVDERWPVLSADGSFVVYAVTQPDGSDLFEMQLGEDGHPVSTDQIANGDGRTLAPLTWAPDGSLLVQISAAHRRVVVERLDIATGTMTPFLHDAGSVAFSPDGTRIAFARPSVANRHDWDIWVSDADGRRAEDVLPLPGAQAYPAWSPDGTSLLFTGWIGDRDADVYLARADGTGVTDLTADSRDVDTSDGWTPDGHITFLSNRSHTGGTFLYVMNADGSDVRLALRI